MPLFPYSVEAPTRTHLSASTVDVLEHWVNYGLGEEARSQLDEFWYELLCGRYAYAARLGSKELLCEFGFVLAEMAENWPSNAFGDEAKVRAWRGLVEDDPTIHND